MFADRFATTTIFEKSRPGIRAAALRAADFPSPTPDELLPAQYRRAKPPRLPSVSEPEIVRHFTRMSKRNFDLDSGFYPLGSCTMKHPPKLRERVLGLAGHAAVHPLQSPARAQGALELMWKVERALAAVTGLPHVCLQPAAGAQGELAGLLLTRAYHAARDDRRTVVLTPETAHGTNPATISMAGYRLVTVAVNADGDLDLADLRAKLSDDVACLMLTNPSTLGLFERNIDAISELVHDVGATLYYDGANLNAIMGICRPGDMGFDIVHLNLHKSFGQPHGGGGPGAGPIAVSDRIAPYLPNPRIARHDDGTGGVVYDLSEDEPDSIGRLRGFHGPFAVAASSYAYIRLLGGAGLRDASETAVLNANYLLARLTTLGVTEYLPAAYDRTCMHEFVLSGVPMRRRLGISTLDLAKRLLDYGFHPPTIYFPLLVDEALLIEPTETETKETLDAFAEAIADILQEAVNPIDRVHGAAHHSRSAPRRDPRGARAHGHPALGRSLATPRRSGAGCGRSVAEDLVEPLAQQRDRQRAIAGDDSRERRALLCAGRQQQRMAGAAQDRQRQRDALRWWLGRLADRYARRLGGLQRRVTGKQRCGMPVGSHPEQHHVEDQIRDARADLEAVQPGGVLGHLGLGQLVQPRRLGAVVGVQALEHHSRIGLGVVVGHAALVAEPQVHVLPRALHGAQQLVGAPRRRAAGKRDVDLAALLARVADPLGERVGGLARDRVRVGKDAQVGHASSLLAAARAGLKVGSRNSAWRMPSPRMPGSPREAPSTVHECCSAERSTRCAVRPPSPRSSASSVPRSLRVSIPCRPGALMRSIGSRRSSTSPRWARARPRSSWPWRVSASGLQPRRSHSQPTSSSADTSESTAS